MTLEQAIDRYSNNAEYERRNGSLHGCMDFRQLAEWLKDYKRLLEQEPCDDAIRRQAVIDITWEEPNYTDALNVLTEVRDKVKELPSVNPQEKTGHWIYKQYGGYPECGNWHCSECRCVVVECVGKEEKGGIPLYKYCPQCGAKMEVSE